MKKKRKRSYTKQIVAGLLVAIMLLLEVATIFAAETETSIETMDISTMEITDQIVFMINDDLFTFPTTVPELIAASNKVYPNIAKEIDGHCVAIYRSSDNLFTITLENITDEAIDTNEAIVRSIVITPQINTMLKVRGTTFEYNSIVSESDLVKIFGAYNAETSYVLNDTETLLSWDFDAYSVSVILRNDMIDKITFTNHKDSLPKISKDSFYNFESGEYYKIEVFENKQGVGDTLATSFYVTKEEKDNMNSRYFFDLYTTNIHPMGYLLQGESIDKLNKDNDYESVLKRLSNQMEQEYYADNPTFIIKSDHQIRQETNMKYLIICSVLFGTTIGIIVYERNKKREKR